MVRRLKRVAPLQAGKIIGILYALLALVLIPFFLLGLLAATLAPASGSGGSGSTEEALGLGVTLVFVVIMPVVYGVMGFLFGLLGAWLYNVIAGWIGGLEFEFE